MWGCVCRVHTELGRHPRSTRNGVWQTSGVTLNLRVLRRYCPGEGDLAFPTKNMFILRREVGQLRVYFRTARKKITTRSWFYISRGAPGIKYPGWTGVFCFVVSWVFRLFARAVLCLVFVCFFVVCVTCAVLCRVFFRFVYVAVFCFVLFDCCVLFLHVLVCFVLFCFVLFSLVPLASQRTVRTFHLV